MFHCWGVPILCGGCHLRLANVESLRLEFRRGISLIRIIEEGFEYTERYASVQHELLERKNGRQMLHEVDDVSRSKSRIGMSDYDRLDDVIGSKRMDRL